MSVKDRFAASPHDIKTRAVFGEPGQQAEVLLAKIMEYNRRANDVLDLEPYEIPSSKTDTHDTQVDSSNTSEPFYPTAIAWLKSFF